MLPTPTKLHYSFSTRDLSRIWQGMMLATADVTNDAEAAVSLWIHECSRVIADRYKCHERCILINNNNMAEYRASNSLLLHLGPELFHGIVY